MRKIYLIPILFFITFRPVFSQSAGDYRTAASGNWNVNGTWQTYNGASWVAAGSSPTSANGVITIQNGHTVTVTADVTVDQVVVNSGGQITVQSSRTITVANGSGTDLSVSGTIDNQGDVSLNSGSVIAYNSGGTYIHNQNSGTVPAATWNAGSTCKITGMGHDEPTGLSQTFYNFTWDCPGQTKDYKRDAILSAINGTMTIGSTGSKKFVLNTNNSGTFNIGGDYVQTGGKFTLTDGSAFPTMNVTGNVSVSGGAFEMSKSSSTGILNVTGNLTYTGGSIEEGKGQGIGSIVFNGTSVQNFTATALIDNLDRIHFTINSGATVYSGTSIFTGGGTFTLSNGGTLGIGSPNGITSSGASGNVQVLGTRTFGTSANYIYNGTAAQNTGNALPASVNNLTDNNTSGVVNLNSNVAVNGTLTIIAIAVFRPSASTIVSGSGTLTGNGTVQVTRTVATPDFNSQFTITNKTLTNLTVDYNAANQVLSNITYGYLKISGSILPGTSNATVGVGLTVTGTFTPTGGTITFNNGSTITNSGTLTFKNITLPNSANVTTASSFNIDGTLNIGTSAVFNATNLAITLKDNAGVTSSGAVNFNSLNIDRPVSGNIVLNGSLTVNGVLDLINGSITVGNYNLTMNSGAAFNNVSLIKYIVTNGTGMLTRNNVGSSSVLFPVGTSTSYNPVSVVNNGTVDNFSVRVQPTFDNSPVDPTKVVNRQWTVNEAVPGGSIGYLSFQFNSGEWAGSFSLLSPMSVGRWNGSAWIGYVADISGSGPYTVANRIGDPITSFSPFGIGNEGSLPVLLAYFNSLVSAMRDVKLNWGTTQEINNKGFDVERNDITKPNTWVKIGFVDGYGNSNESHDYSFEDKKLNAGTFKYRLKQIDYNGNFEYFYLSNDVIIGKPADYSVSQNYPNPSNPNSKIDYQLPFDARVTIKLYDLLGREVATIIDKTLEAGYYTEIVEGSNLSSGIYIYRFTASGNNLNFTRTMKMILLK